MKKNSTGKMLCIATVLLTLILCSSPVLAFYQTITPWPMCRYDRTHTASSPSSSPNSNTTLWTTEGGWYQSAPTVAGGLVFVVRNDGTMYCFDETTGVLLWTTHLSYGFRGEPAVAGDRLYASAENNYMYVLDTTTGAKVTEYYGQSGYVTTSPVVSNGNIYFGSTDGKLIALDADWNPLWEYQAGGGISSTPCVDDSGVYFGCNDGKIYGLDPTTGTKKWEYYTGNTETNPDWDWIYSSPTVANDMIFAGSSLRNHFFFAVNKTSGASIWNYTLTDQVRPKSLAFSEGFVYCTAGNRVYKLLANATTGTYAETDSNIRKGVYDLLSEATDCSIAGGKLFVSAYNSGIYALNKTSALTRIWSYMFPVVIVPSASPTVADGRVFVPTWGSGLYCFGEPFPPVTYQYTISAGNADWNLALTINATPSSTLNSSVLISQKKLSWTLQGITNTTGMSNISIPIGMLGGPFTSITVDGSPPIYTETTTNETYSFVYLTYNHSAHTVEIVGSTVVPEFPTLAPLAILMFAAMTASLFACNFRSKKPT